MPDIIRFWEYVWKKGRISLLLYPLIALLLLLGYYQAIQRLTGNVLSVDFTVAAVLTVGIYALFFLFLPAMPRDYRQRFKDKFRKDLSEEELRQQLMELIERSLKHISFILLVLLGACVTAYAIAQRLGLPESTSWVLVIGTGLNIYLVSLLLVSLGKDNKDHMRKTYVEAEYRRYASLENYRNVFLILAAIDIALAILLVMNLAFGITVF